MKTNSKLMTKSIRMKVYLTFHETNTYDSYGPMSFHNHLSNTQSRDGIKTYKIDGLLTAGAWKVDEHTKSSGKTRTRNRLKDDTERVNRTVIQPDKAV